MTCSISELPAAAPTGRPGPGLRLAAAVGLVWFGGCHEERPPTGPLPPAEVAVVTLKAERVALTTELPGRTSAYRIAEVRPRVGGVILERLFAEGADVQAGQPLYRLDSRRFAAELERAAASVKRAEADLSDAQYELGRLTALKANQVVADKEYQQARFAEQRARAALDLAVAEQRIAALHLEWTEVTAPLSGRIGYSSVTEGALVTAEQPTPLTTIQQFDPLYVDVTQSSAELLRLKRDYESGALRVGGDQRAVRLLLEDGTPYPEEGTLQFRDITVDPTTGSYTLRLVFSNARHLLLPGMFVRAIVHEGTAEQALLVPQQGVSRNPKGEAVALIVDDAGKVQQRLLTLNRAIGNRWLVSAGLNAGDRLIVEGALRVRPGDAVKVVSAEGGPDPAAAGEAATPTTHPQ
ncbi:MAG: efflux RND transporter periplasmic adaptor subunit [Planctomycetota bacterium]